MQTGNIVEASRACALIAPHLKGSKHFKLAYKLDRLARRLTDDEKSYKDADARLFEELGTESVIFTSEETIYDLEPVEPKTYLVDASTFDDQYKGVGGITEKTRGKLQIGKDNIAEYRARTNDLLNEEVSALPTDKIPLSMFDGVEVPEDGPSLGELVIALREFIQED